MRDLISASPLGVFGMFIAGLANGTVLGMGAVYARIAGFSIPDTALFMALLTIGAAVLQWPIGKLSDRFDRRIIMALVAALVIVASLADTNSYLKSEQMVGASSSLVLILGA